MCGIVGYIGDRQACRILVDGLKRLEYRGYDSAGVAILDDGDIRIHKSVGNLKALELSLDGKAPVGSLGIGHTRWATHGRPSNENSHPHSDCTGNIAVVHNGIIENYLVLKNKLVENGHKFTSETDTEVAAHLIESLYDGDLLKAVSEACKQLEGSFALVVVSSDQPGRIVAARRHSPLAVGLGEGENYLASDVSAFLQYSKSVIYVEDNNVAELTRDCVKVYDLNGNIVDAEITEIDWDASMAERGGYDHYMIKEIHEQPHALREALRGRLKADDDTVMLPGLNLTDEEIKKIDRIVMIACGTAYHASIAGKYVFESLCRIPVEVDVASELRYRDPVIDEHVLGIVITQSGETIDTIVGLREVRDKGAKVVTITNVVGSLAAREADGVLYTYAGPEIAVASTKAYTTQMMVLNLVALRFAQVRGTITHERSAQLCAALRKLPDQADDILEDYNDLLALANHYYCFNQYLLMARGINLASALEGALKIKEISYMHAEGYAAGEMKHGPIAMIDPCFVTLAIAPRSATYDKMLGNIREIKARSGDVIAVATYGDQVIGEYADHILRIPETEEIWSPILIALPLQLFAYHVAKFKVPGIDQPRNLAKTVTVE